MLAPDRRNIINKVIQKEKNRHVMLYVSVFFILGFAVFLFSSFRPPGNNNIPISPPDNEDTIFVYDTVYYYDTTFVFDTVFLSEYFSDTTKIIINKLRNEEILYKNYDFLLKNNELISSRKYLFSFDLFFSPMFSIHSFQSDFIYNNFSELNKNSVQEDLSGTFGFGINFHKPFVTYSSGLSYTVYRENFNFLATDFLIDTIMAYKYFTTTETMVDTIEFYNIDSLLIGDTVIEYYYDTTRITRLDSNLVSKLDSVDYQRSDKSANSYSYLEIPFIYSFNIYKPNFYFSPQIGIITSIFIDSKGKIVSLTNLNQSNGIEDESKLAKINISVYAGLRFNYYLNRRFDFFTSAYFRKNINSVYRDYPIVSRFNTFGFKFGLRYKLTL